MEQAQRTFSYTARDARGARRSGVVTGTDETDATRALRAMGLFPISLEDGTAGAPAGRPVRRAVGSLSQRQTTDFLVRLAKLSSRQIQAERALAIIGDGGDDPIALAARRVRDSLREGAPLSQALRDKAGITDAVTLSLIGGAEVSGDMGSALSTAAEIMQTRLVTRRRIVTGLTYPSILLAVAVLSVGLIMVAIIPQFRPLIADRMAMVPPMGRAVFAVSGVLSALWPLILLGLLGLAGAMVYAARAGLLMRLIQRAGHAAPFLRRLLLRNEMMLVLHVLGALLQRDITLSGALRVVSRAAGSAAMQEGMANVTRQVESGTPLSTALRASGLLSSEAIEMIRIGEEAGDLGTMISRTSADMRDAADRDLERFLLLFQPALIVVVGLMIGVSLYALFSAIVAVNAISF